MNGIFESYLLSLINLSLIIGYFLYFLGFFRLVPQKLTTLGISLLLGGIFLFTFYMIDTLIKDLFKQKLDLDISKVKNLIRRKKISKQEAAQEEIVIYEKYFQTTLILALIATTCIILFVASWYRLIGGHNGLQMFNFLNF